MSPAAETTTTVRPETAEETSVQPREPVVVHVRVPAYTTEMVRVWQSTFLLDRDSNHTSRLVSFEKISLYPHWTKIDYTRPYVFTLVFEGQATSTKSTWPSEAVSRWTKRAVLPRKEACKKCRHPFRRC